MTRPTPQAHGPIPAPELLAALTRALAPGLALRHRTDGDLPFLAFLYACVREEELRQVDWPPERKNAFLQDQFTRQHQHYLQHYPQALWLLIERDGACVGRLYVEQTRAEIRLMEVSLLPQHRNRGIGSALLDALLAHADRAMLPVSLHVEPFNPAFRMYQRAGFITTQERGVYCYMQRPARGPQLKINS